MMKPHLGDQYARNAIQGARNRAAGLHFEQIIEASCQHYRYEEIAEIDKTPEPFAVERHVGQGKFIGHYQKQAQPDFKGTLAGGGSIVFEAKHTEQSRIEQSVVTPEQTRALIRHFKMGADCSVIISFGFSAFYRVPWTVWLDMKRKYGRKYLTPEDIPEYRITYTGGTLRFLEGKSP